MQKQTDINEYKKEFCTFKCPFVKSNNLYIISHHEQRVYHYNSSAKSKCINLLQKNVLGKKARKLLKLLTHKFI